MTRRIEMQKIPYRTQIDSAAQNLYLTPEFCQKVLRGLSMTKMRDLYQADFPLDLTEAGLFKYVDEDELYDTLTFGELCSEAYKLRQARGRKKELVERLAAYPFIKTSEVDRRFSLLHKGESKSQADSAPPDVSPFDPEYLNRLYRLCENSSDARYFYWTRWMTEEQFLSAAYALTESKEISRIIADYHVEGRTFECRVQYIGEDLGSYEEVMKKYDSPYDEYGWKTFQNLKRAESENNFFRLAENFIIIPIAKIYQITQKGEIYHET